MSWPDNDRRGPAPRRMLRVVLGSAVVTVLLSAGAPAALAVPPPPPNPSDSQLSAASSAANGQAVQVGALVKRLSDAQTQLDQLTHDVARKRELANKARVDLQRAENDATAAAAAVAAAQRQGQAAQAAIENARRQVDQFAAGSYQQSSTVGSLSAYLGSASPEDVLARAQLLDAVSSSQLGVMDTLQRARTQAANADSAARAAKGQADATRRRADQAKQTADGATQTAVNAQRSQGAQAQQLESNRNQAQYALDQARNDVAGLQGQRQAFEQWDAQRRAEEAAAARAAAEEAARQRAAAEAAAKAAAAQQAAAQQAAAQQAAAQQAAAQQAAAQQAAAQQAAAQQAAAQQADAQRAAAQQAAAADAAGERSAAAAARQRAADAETAAASARQRAADAESAAASARQRAADAVSAAQQQAAPARSVAAASTDGSSAGADSSGDGSGNGGASGGGSSTGDAQTVIDRAMSELGVRYSWGGGNAEGATVGVRDGGVADSYGDYYNVGFDCSGLMVYAFAGAGVSLPHYSGYQYTSGEHIPLSQMQPGDMVFYGPDGSEHVALYIGNDKMIEAPESGEVVTISTVRYGGIMPYAVRMF